MRGQVEPCQASLHLGRPDPLQTARFRDPPQRGRKRMGATSRVDGDHYLAAVREVEAVLGERRPERVAGIAEPPRIEQEALDVTGIHAGAHRLRSPLRRDGGQ